LVFLKFGIVEITLLHAAAQQATPKKHHEHPRKGTE